MAKCKGLNREMKKKGGGNISRCYRSLGGKPKLSICERNLAFMWVCGNSRIQLGSLILDSKHFLEISEFYFTSQNIFRFLLTRLSQSEKIGFVL